MSWVWMIAAVWVTLAFGVAAGWALRGSIQAPPELVEVHGPAPMEWVWPTFANTTASVTMTTIGRSEEPPATGMREPRRPRPQPPHLALVREYAPTMTVIR